MMPPTISAFNTIDIISLDQSGSIKDRLENLVASIRVHLDMDVSLITQFTPTQMLFRYVNAKPEAFKIEQGSSAPLEGTICKRVVDGRLPPLMHDARKHPVAAKLEVTNKFPVGAHLSVPIVLEDGEIYGTLCCFSHSPNCLLSERDLHMMEAFAEIAARDIQIEQQQERKRQQLAERINTNQVVIANSVAKAMTTLGSRELQVLQLMTEGFSSGEIAEKLTISKQTVSVHKRNIKYKLDIHNLAELIKFPTPQ